MVDEGTVGSETKGTVSFSIRLSEKQRDLLTQAADKRGWTVTTLLKNAALEKASHIVNTSSPNRVDFRGAAEAVAREVFTTPQVRTFSPDGQIVTLNPVDSLAEIVGEAPYFEFAEVSPWPMPRTFLNTLRDAARFGGIEFLDLIIQSADAIVSRELPNLLPEPIDPSTV